jgi:predicted phosphodiesterase
MRLLCISDIHGRADALAAVLATAERRGYDRLLVAGDLCFPGPEPLETWRALTRAGAACVQGTGDRALVALDVAGIRPKSPHERARLDRLAAVRAELGDLILARIGRLPQTLRIPLGAPGRPVAGSADGGELLLVHGSPVDPFEPLSHDMSDDEISALIGDDPADVIVCGGSHVPFDRMVQGVRVVNVGSVGEAPSGIASAGAASGHADATFLEIVGGELSVVQFSVPLGKAA